MIGCSQRPIAKQWVAATPTIYEDELSAALLQQVMQALSLRDEDRIFRNLYKAGAFDGDALRWLLVGFQTKLDANAFRASVKNLPSCGQVSSHEQDEVVLNSMGYDTGGKLELIGERVSEYWITSCVISTRGLNIRLFEFSKKPSSYTFNGQPLTQNLITVNLAVDISKSPNRK